MSFSYIKEDHLDLILVLDLIWIILFTLFLCHRVQSSLQGYSFLLLIHGLFGISTECLRFSQIPFQAWLIREFHNIM